MGARRLRKVESIGFAVLIAFAMTLGVDGVNTRLGIVSVLAVVPLLATVFYRMWPVLQQRREEAARLGPFPRQDLVKLGAILIGAFVVVTVATRFIVPDKPFDPWSIVRVLCLLTPLVYVQWPRWRTTWRRWRDDTGHGAGAPS